jgi:tRNA-2-methylthio-N6-dimethylallyladenosine synthase
VSFARLLELIAQKTTLSRLRFTTSHPKDVKDDLIDQFVNNPILVPHFHLPVQSGANRILNLMRRQYTRDDYLNTVTKLKQRVPGIQFSTDIIVGFPTETNEEFEATLSLMREVEFSLSFYFIYSPRPHTGAVKIVDDIPPAIKSERFTRLDALNDELVLRSNLLDVGSVQDVLVEAVDEDSATNSGQGLCSYVGRTPTHKVVHFSCEVGEVKPGDFLPVQILRANPYSLYGTGNEKKFNALDPALSLNDGEHTHG